VTPLVEELTPWQDPWLIARRLCHLRGLLLLDSATIHPSIGRYTFLAADPFGWISSRRERVRTEWFSRGDRTLMYEEAGDPFAVLQRHLARFQAESIPGLPPFQGGVAGLFGYDLCHHIERLPRPRHDEFETPDLAVGLYDWVISFDHEQRRVWLISSGFSADDARQRPVRAVERAREVQRVLRAGDTRSIPVRMFSGSQCLIPRAALFPSHSLRGRRAVLSNFAREDYLTAVRRAIEYIHAGDCFQVNLSQRLLHPATLSPIDLYVRVRERNPAPFGGYFDLGDLALISASPERFLRVEKGLVETRPIKGTRPRGVTPREDERQRLALLHSPKDRAENVMIIDLLRNDLGRVCAYGSVQVPAVCRLESYRTVHHLVSEVVGRLRPGLGPVDLLRAAFPGGSVTGAPKVRAMEIIAELEPTARGPYCGSLGYIGFDGSMDTNILIRTFTVGRGWMQFPVGGGIVADSTPEAEYDETLHKAEGLLRALR
jgi:para-aminobenzoate synthetase component 1